MKLRMLIPYSRRRLKGSRRYIFLVCALPLGAHILLWAVEAALYSLLLYFGALTPPQLFTAASPDVLFIAVCFGAMRLVFCAPLECAAAVRLSEFTAGLPRTSFSEMLLSGRFIRRSVSAKLFGRTIAAAALLPGVIAGYAAVRIVSDGADTTELFAASAALAVTIISGWLWAALRLQLTAVPWLMAANPEKGGISAVMRSFRFMSGRRDLPAKLLLAYIVPSVTVVGLPFVIPEAAAAFSQGIAIFLEEDRYAGSRAPIKGGTTWQNI